MSPSASEQYQGVETRKLKNMRMSRSKSPWRPGSFSWPGTCRHGIQPALTADVLRALPSTLSKVASTSAALSRGGRSVAVSRSSLSQAKVLSVDAIFGQLIQAQQPAQ